MEITHSVKQAPVEMPTGILLDLTPEEARMVAPVLRIGIHGAAAHSTDVVRFWQGVLGALDELGCGS